MNPSRCPPAAGRRTALVGAVVVFLVLLPPAAGRAEPPAPAGSRPAEKTTRADELREADQLHRHALDTRDEAERVVCFDRALEIYVRLGRPQQAIQVGRKFRRFLEAGGAAGRVRDLDLLLGECFLVLGHYASAEDHLRRGVRDDSRLGPPPPVLKIAALAHLVRSASRRGDDGLADDYWRQLEAFAGEQLDGRHEDFTARQWIECTWKLADGYGSRRRPEAAARAIERLVRLLPTHDQMHDPARKRDTLRRLADHHAARKEYAEAENYLRQALKEHSRLKVPEPIIHAELAEALAEVVGRRERKAETDRLLGEAVHDYLAVLNPPEGRRPEAAQVVTAFWQLQSLYERAELYSRALSLAEDHEKQWGGLLRGPRLTSQRGALRVILGSSAAARNLLRDAVEILDREEPRNLADLPRAYNNLAIVEQEGGDPDSLARAAGWADKCRRMYEEEFKWPDDPVLVEAYNVKATCAAAGGRYYEAIDLFNTAASKCENLENRLRPAYAQHSMLLLNKALLYKSQGDLRAAQKECKAARDKYERFAPHDALRLAAFDAADASLSAARGEIDEAQKTALRLQAVFKQYEIKSGPLLVTYWHCEGLYHLYHRNLAKASEAWGKVRELQEKGSPLLPRTLNYLGLTAELGGDAKEAGRLYREALRVQEGNRQAFPVTHFITLWHLARLAEHEERWEEVRQWLEKAVEVVEKARYRTTGTEQQRVAFFAQFEPAFDQLIEACLHVHDPKAAFAVTVRSRSRALLDQLQVAHVDPLAALPPDRARKLRSEEEQLVQRINALQCRLWKLLPQPTDQGQEDPAALQAGAEKLRADLDLALDEYGTFRRKIYEASPVFRVLSADDAPGKVLATLEARLRDRKAVLLTYYIGRERSYLMLKGASTEWEVYPLIVPPGAAEQLAQQAPRAMEAADKKSRTITPERGRGPSRVVPPVRPVRDGDVALNQDLARELVDYYRAQLQPEDSRTLGVEPPPPDRRGLPLEDDLPGRVLLPPDVRRRIRDLAPEYLLVIPDGALHKLPLEALVLAGKPTRQYAIDVLPPIAYAPSAAILAWLAERSPPAGDGQPSLLTVFDPAYPEKANIRRLRHTGEESRAIRKFFQPHVTELGGERATRQAVKDELKGKQVIHIAAHGRANLEDQSDNLFGLFGTLLLTPSQPVGGGAGDNGFFYLYEISTLPLNACELAVLSACDTNVGPVPPLEAGVTLANAFVTAGARRVVASHWHVDDVSTAALMQVFFEKRADGTRPGGRANYARALQEARRAVREKSGWSDPYHWAPFVLIGWPD